MKKGIVFIVPLVFCWIVTVQANAEMKITPGGVTTPDSSASLHLIGNFSGSIVQNPPGAVISGRNSYAGSDASIGGYFTAAGTNADGVFAIATGIGGKAIFGWASNSGSSTGYGGYFVASGSTGTGVYGYASSTNGTGVSGLSPSMGVQGEATNSANVTNWGGNFKAAGVKGRGVYGIATNLGGENYGGFFQSNGSSGRGVYGIASGSTGTGVYGVAVKSTNVMNYGGYFSASGYEGRGVYGQATKIGPVTNYGGYFFAAGDDGSGVYGSADGDDGSGVYGFADGIHGIGVYGDGKEWNFYGGGPGSDYGPFTGAHEVKFAQDMPGEIVPGMIVSTTGKTEARKDKSGRISLSSTLPTVTLSIKANDKAVFGVIVSDGPLPKNHWYESQEAENFGVVNALGEGRVWVTNRNGNIENGDYITTSDIPGHGQMQDDDFLHSYTLGKAIETIDWEQVTENVEYDGKTYKRYLIAIVYTSG